jgi:alpha-L-rhamnosidase
VLVLPDHRVLSLPALRKVHALVREGATVVGPRPRGTASLVGYPESEQVFQQLVNELWGDDPSRPGTRSFGKGRLVEGRAVRQVRTDAEVVPDFECPRYKSLDYLHRALEEGEVYFVSNREPTGVTARCRFRVSGRQPELWDPVKGTVRPLDSFEQAEGRTTIALEFDPYGSLFVVFRRVIDAGAQGTAASNFRKIVASESLPGPWAVEFDPGLGGPGSVAFDRLIDWTAHGDPAVRFYSGTARYQTTFDLPRERITAGDRWLLDLGDVRELAEVRLNDKPLGVVWAVPFRVDITDAVKPVENRLEVAVVNTWRNRLVGGRDLPPGRRITVSNIQAAPDWRPIASGLLGPVRLQIAR